MVKKEIVQTEFDDSFFINAADLGSVAASIPIKAGTPLMKAFTGQVLQDPQDGDNDLPDLAILRILEWKEWRVQMVIKPGAGILQENLSEHGR